MQITAVEYPDIRRLEAVSFRSFPATMTYFNGTWAIRLTRGHPSKRLNSINPLDPGDCWDIKRRLEQEIRRFDKFGRPVVFRLTPLASEGLIRHLDELGWVGFDEIVVMILDLDGLDLAEATDRLPFKDTGYWVDAVLKMGDDDEKLKPGMVEIIKATRANTDLFLLESNGKRPLSALRTVLDDKFIGLFNIVTSVERQRQGLAASLLLSALRRARHAGAKRAWLQVLASNHPAISLYKSMGFGEFYHYVYRQPPPVL